MRSILLRSGLLLALAALVPACGGGDDTTSADCQKICETIGPLKCPMEKADTCVSMCEQTANSPVCTSQLKALLKCSAPRPVSDWECGSDGEADLKAGVCDPEGQALFACVLGGGS